MHHYKSWQGLGRQLTDRLCEPLKGRITYFLTRYHRVHDAYGRASVRLDGEELICFSWREQYTQEKDIYDRWTGTGEWDADAPELKEKWDNDAIYSDRDFLEAATEYLELPIGAALESDDLIIRMFAILDRRVGKRTLERISREKKYIEYPEWLRRMFELRLKY